VSFRVGVFPWSTRELWIGRARCGSGGRVGPGEAQRAGTRRFPIACYRAGARDAGSDFSNRIAIGKASPPSARLRPSVAQKLAALSGGNPSVPTPPLKAGEAAQVATSFGYQIARNFHVDLGYRALAVDYDQDGLRLDYVAHGPQVTLGFHF
jgi:hypothetical protein